MWRLTFSNKQKDEKTCGKIYYIYDTIDLNFCLGINNSTIVSFEFI